MALMEGQVQVRDLVMGPGTPFTLFRFNPWQRNVRATSNPRAWAHGTWSGAEWADEKIIPLRIIVADDPVTRASWFELDQQLAEAFAPVEDTGRDVEMTFRWGGRDFLVFGRPRMVDPDVERVGGGWTLTQAAFVANDPFVYAAEATIAGPISLPRFSAGLVFPAVFPFGIDARLVGGELALVNEGRARTGLVIRLDGPIDSPRVSLVRPDGSTQQLRFHFALDAGEHVLVDTAARTVFLNGQPEASVRGLVSGDFPVLPPGESQLRFRAAEHNDIASMSATFRSAWR